MCDLASLPGDRSAENHREPYHLRRPTDQLDALKSANHVLHFLRAPFLNLATGSLFFFSDETGGVFPLLIILNHQEQNTKTQRVSRNKESQEKNKSNYTRVSSHVDIRGLSEAFALRITRQILA